MDGKKPAHNIGFGIVGAEGCSLQYFVAFPSRWAGE